MLLIFPYKAVVAGGEIGLTRSDTEERAGEQAAGEQRLVVGQDPP